MFDKLKVKYYAFQAKQCKYGLHKIGLRKCSGEFYKDILFDDEYKLNKKCRYCDSYIEE